MTAAGLVLAAGEGRRFGGPKQLAPFRGEPLLSHALASMRSAGTGSLAPLVLVLGARAEEILAGVDAGGFGVVVAEDWAEGQAASLRAGVAAVGDADSVLVCLGDQPLITPAVIAATLEHDDEEVDAVRATYEGVPGHPVLLKRAVLDRVAELRGDTGARDLLAGFRVRTWEAGHLCDPTDVDTPEALEALTP